MPNAATAVTYNHNAWKDRFNRPTVTQLRKLLEGTTASFDEARKRLLDLDGVQEVTAWYGDSWHWTIEYRVDQSDEPLALLVPSPTDLQIAVPLDREFVQTLPMSRMSRALRDGLELAQEPFDTRWGVWTVQTGSLLDSLQDLIERKLRHLAKRAG